MIHIHFTGTANAPTLQLKREPPAMTDTDHTPTYLPLFNCLKQMIPLVNYPRLRFVLPRGPNEPDARIDFYYFQEDDTVHLHYRELHHDNIYLGPIDSTGELTPKPFPEQSKRHIDDLLYKLQLDFTDTIETYGQHTHLCALCGQPLIDPSSLARGTTPNCAPHLLPPANLNDI